MAILYGANRFTLKEVELASYRNNILKSFISSIGSVNAGPLAHLRISFPATERWMTAQEKSGSGKTPHKICSLSEMNECTGLKTLETLVCWILQDMARGFSSDACAHRGGS